jgi:hypothetical protein
MLVVVFGVPIVLRRRGQYGVYGACLGDISSVRYISLLDTYIMMAVFWKLVAFGNWAGHRNRRKSNGENEGKLLCKV